jgi:hypothetical protein
MAAAVNPSDHTFLYRVCQTQGHESDECFHVRTGQKVAFADMDTRS